MGIREAYKVFGLALGTELSEVKKRYRQLMMLVHPDANTAEEITDTMFRNSIEYIKNAYIGILPLDVFCILYFTFTFPFFALSCIQLTIK